MDVVARESVKHTTETDEMVLIEAMATLVPVTYSGSMPKVGTHIPGVKTVNSYKTSAVRRVMLKEYFPSSPRVTATPIRVTHWSVPSHTVQKDPRQIWRVKRGMVEEIKRRIARIHAGTPAKRDTRLADKGSGCCTRMIWDVTFGIGVDWISADTIPVPGHTDPDWQSTHGLVPGIMPCEEYPG